MIKPSLVDDVTIFLNRMIALADGEYTDEFVALFESTGATLMPVQNLNVLDSSESIRNWHQSIFNLLEVLKLNVELQQCSCVDSLIFVQACFRCQFCLLKAPDQLEAMSLRVSLAIRKTECGLKIIQMHCSLPGGSSQKGIQIEIIDPFADE